MQLITPSYELLNDNSVVKRSQEIPDDFLSHLADTRLASNGHAGDMHQFASIPTVVIDHWMRQGFDVFNESAANIMARLRSEDLSAFITTNKNL